MIVVEITGNGVFSLDIPNWHEYSIVYPSDTVGAATVQLLGFGTALANGLITSGDQYKIEHGRSVKLEVSISDFEAPFTLTVTGG